MENIKYKGIDKTKILEVQKVKLQNTDAYAKFTEEELKNICSIPSAVERLYKGIENQLKVRMNDTEMAIICEMAMMYLDSLKDKEAADKEAYNKGLNDAWELAKKLWLPSNRGGLPYYEVKKIFECDYYTIAENYTPQEAIAKLEAYEKEQNEIKVGDVVEATDLFGDVFKGIVLDFKDGAENEVFVLYENGCVDVWEIADCKKTGKHIHIQTLLDELKEGTE